jgi:polyphosphate kinase
VAVRRSKKGTAQSRLFDRELSWLEWDARVLALVGDERIPLLERLRFTAIFSSNLDEFCMVRVAELLEAVRDSPHRPRTAGDLLPSEVLDRVGARMRDLVEQQSSLTADLLVALAKEGVAVVPVSAVDASERGELAAMYHGTIFPVLTPLAVGPGRPFPYISNLSLSLGVMLRDPETGQRRLARVKVPEVLPRFLAVGDDGDRFVALEDLIAAHLDSLFPGMEIEEQAAFRVTRDADFEIEEAADDLLSAVERELRRRRFGEVVRVELASSMSAGMRHQLLAHLHADDAYVYAVDGLLDHADLVELAGLERSDLRYPEWQGVTRPRLRGDGDADTPADIFAAIREGDIFVNHPYDRFSTSVERLIEQAVDDPDVLAIKHTIYRTSGDSPMVPALIRAAEQGKQAVVLVELKARFDEARNIGWSRALERAGVHVVHGFPALKTHAKCALVVRREHGGIRRYVHIGTGNYHPRTARLYTDAGLFTCRPDIAADVSDLFNYLTGFGRPQRYRKLLVAPTDLRERIIDEVRRVSADAAAGGRGRIVLKMNGLVDRPVIESLYEASQAGVQVDLVVRGICCLRPGVPGLSDNIGVTSVLGRFLEHERLFAFHGEQSSYFLGSADMMPRNLDSRVEVLVPVEDPALRADIDFLLETSLADTRSSFRLRSDGTWERRRPAQDELEHSAQEELMARALEAARVADEDADREEAAERIVRAAKRRGEDIA